jgi:hypothetical protein
MKLPLRRTNGVRPAYLLGNPQPTIKGPGNPLRVHCVGFDDPANTKVVLALGGAAWMGLIHYRLYVVARNRRELFV